MALRQQNNVVTTKYYHLPTSLFVVATKKLSEVKSPYYLYPQAEINPLDTM